LADTFCNDYSPNLLDKLSEIFHYYSNKCKLCQSYIYSEVVFTGDVFQVHEDDSSVASGDFRFHFPHKPLSGNVEIGIVTQPVILYIGLNTSVFLQAVHRFGNYFFLVSHGIMFTKSGRKRKIFKIFFISI